MNFYQYWIVLIILFLVIITLINIIKMLGIFNENSFKNNDLVKKNLTNLFISLAFLSITSLVYILMVFNS